MLKNYRGLTALSFFHLTIILSFYDIYILFYFCRHLPTLIVFQVTQLLLFSFFLKRVFVCRFDGKPTSIVVLNILIIIIIRCQIWNRHWRPCLSKHLCHQATSKNFNPYFVHLLPSYKDYQEMLFFVCPYRVCLLLFQLKIRIPSLYVYTHVLKFHLPLPNCFQQ